MSTPRPTPRKPSGCQPLSRYPQVFRYQSYTAYCADTALVAPDPADAAYCATACEEWDDDIGFSGAVDAARIGHPDYATKIATFAEAVRRHLPPFTAPTPQWSTSPDTPEWSLDVAAHVSGDPEPFRTYPERIRPDPIALVVNISMSCGIPAECGIRRGAVIAAVVHALQEHGHEVAIYASVFATNPDDPTNKPVGCLWPVPDQPHQIAWNLAHPASLRRMWMHWSEQYHPMNMHGRPITEAHVNRAIAKNALGAHTVLACFPGLYPEHATPYMSDGAAIKEAEKIIRKLIDQVGQVSPAAPV